MQHCAVLSVAKTRRVCLRTFPSERSFRMSWLGDPARAPTRTRRPRFFEFTVDLFGRELDGVTYKRLPTDNP